MSQDNRASWPRYFMDIAHLVAQRSTCLRRKVGAIAGGASVPRHRIQNFLSPGSSSSKASSEQVCAILSQSLKAHGAAK